MFGKSPDVQKETPMFWVLVVWALVAWVPRWFRLSLAGTGKAAERVIMLMITIMKGKRTNARFVKTALGFMVGCRSVGFLSQYCDACEIGWEGGN